MNAHQPPKRQIGTHNCPECSSPAVCDLEKGKSVCWCFSQPANKNKELRQEEAQCLCRKCLKKEK